MTVGPAPIDADAMPDAAVPDDGTVCIRCGYSLVGLDRRRPCPECGLLVGFSLLDGGTLHHNRPRWLVKLSIGAGMCAAAIVLSLLISIGMELIDQSTRNRLGFTATSVDWIQWGLGLAIAAFPMLLLWIGCLLLVSRAGIQRGDATDPRTRRFLLAAGLVPLLVLVAGALSMVELLPSMEEDVVVFASLAAVALTGVVYAVLFFHLKGLAERAPAPLLAADSPIVGIVFGLCLLTPLIMAMMAYMEIKPPDRGPGVWIWMTLMAIWMSIGLTSVLWSIYLLIRYAVAFGRSAAQARELMRRFDAAEPMPDAGE